MRPHPSFPGITGETGESRRSVFRDYHPRNSEFVRHHSEARREKRLAQRHEHLSARGKRLEALLGLGIVRAGEREIDALEFRLARAAPFRPGNVPARGAGFRNRASRPPALAAAAGSSSARSARSDIRGTGTSYASPLDVI